MLTGTVITSTPVMAAAKLSEPWQVDKSLVECNQYMLDHGISDVTFKLDYKGGKVSSQDPVYVRALQTLLLARSPVFHAMFSGDLAERTASPVIDVNDVEPDAFKEMIRFMYTDEAHLTADNVVSILYASKKYILTTLTTRCTDFLQQQLSADTAPQILEQSMMFSETELTRKALETIQGGASAVLKSEDFVKLSTEALHEVLQLNLNITNELEVFEASIRWAQNKCRQLKKPTDGASLREVLGDNLFLIRFPTMNLDDFSDNVTPCDMLSSNEENQLFRYLTGKSKPEHLPFSVNPRCGLQTRGGPSRIIDQTPRSLIAPGPYAYVDRNQYGFYSTNLTCRISKPMQLQKIYIHAGQNHDGVARELNVYLTRKTTLLQSYSGACAFTPGAAGIPDHYAVSVNNVRVAAGALQLYIKVVFTNSGYYSSPTTAPETSNLSDEYLSVDFTPVGRNRIRNRNNNNNLLLGFEYSPAI